MQHLECFGTAALKKTKCSVGCTESCRDFRACGHTERLLSNLVYSEDPQNFDEVINGVHLFSNYSIYDLSKTMYFPFPVVLKHYLI